jgi:hypothetical protein
LIAIVGYRNQMGNTILNTRQTAAGQEHRKCTPKNVPRCRYPNNLQGGLQGGLAKILGVQLRLKPKKQKSRSAKLCHTRSMNARFQYVLTMPKQNLGDASPLFGFTPGTLTVVPILKTVLALPQHIMQLGFGRDACIAMRIGGATYGIMPAEVDALPYLPIGEDIPFWCVFSTPETRQAVADFVQQTRHPLLHASRVDRSGSVLAQNLTSNDLLGLLKRVVDFLPQLLNESLVQSLYTLDAPRDTWVPARVSVTRRNHFCTLANEVTLASQNATLSIP